MGEDVVIHIGPHKTGTTFLQKRVFNQSALGLASPWEASEYIVRVSRADPMALTPDSIRAHFDPGIESVLAKGLRPVLSHESLYGLPWEGGYPNPYVLDALAEAYPHARVFMVAREQRDMIGSIYRHRVRGFYGGSIRDFLADPPPGHLPVFQKQYVAYHRVQRHLLERFGQSRVAVLLYEDLKADAGAFVASVVEFCGGVPLTSAMTFDHRENRGLSATTIAMKRFPNRMHAHVVAPNDSPYQHAVNAIFNKGDVLVPRRVADWSARRLRKAIDDEIGNFYADSNAAMQRAQPERLTLARLAAAGYQLPA